MYVEAHSIEKRIFEQIEQGKVEETIRECKNMLAMYDFQESVFLYPLLAQAYMRLGDYDTSQYYIQNGITLAKVQKDKAAEAKAYILQSTWIVGLQGDMGEAMRIQDKARLLAEEAGDEVLCIRCYNNMAAICMLEEHYKEAAKWLDKLLTYPIVEDEYMSKLVFITSRVNRGRIYIREQAYEEAQCILEEVVEKEALFDAPRHIAMVYYSLAELHKGMRNYEEAKRCLNKTIAIYKELNNEFEASEAYQMLSEVYELMGDYDLALHYYKEYAKGRINCT